MSASLSRFQIVQGNPPNLPHKCTICGSIEGTFIDFQLDLEFYGTVYFCVENCFTQLANELGYRSPKQHQVVLESNEWFRKKCNEYIDTIERLEDAVDTLRSLDYRDRSASRVSDRGDDPEGSRKSEDTGDTSEDQSDASRQNSGPGSSNLFDDDGLADLLEN